MVASSELENADILELANTASALRKALRQYEKSRTLLNHRGILKRGKHLIGSIMAGSLRSPREEVNRLLPEGAELYESVRAYGYATRTWAMEGETVTAADDEQRVATLLLYAQCLNDIEQTKPFEEWSAAEITALENLVQFLRALERILIGELNSRRAADLMQEDA
jgi:hypothetical protein